MGKQHEQKAKILRGPRIYSVGDRDANSGIIRGRRRYIADTWAAALVHIELILLRGNAVRSINAAGQYVITELVMQ